MANFLAAHPVPDDSPLIMKLLNEEAFTTEDTKPCWDMYFEEASRLSTISERGTIKKELGQVLSSALLKMASYSTPIHY